jgi:hypothetical protein
MTKISDRADLHQEAARSSESYAVVQAYSTPVRFWMWGLAGRTTLRAQTDWPRHCILYSSCTQARCHQCTSFLTSPQYLLPLAVNFPDRRAAVAKRPPLVPAQLVRCTQVRESAVPCPSFVCVPVPTCSVDISLGGRPPPEADSLVVFNRTATYQRGPSKSTKSAHSMLYWFHDNATAPEVFSS